MALTRINIPSGNPNIELSATDPLGVKWEIYLQTLTTGQLAATVHRNGIALASSVLAVTQSPIVRPIYSPEANLVWFDSNGGEITSESVGSSSSLFFISGDDLEGIYGRA